MASFLGIDPRSLVAFRVALGLTVVVDLATRATSLTAHYTDAGVLPRAVALLEEPPVRGWCLHYAAGSTLAMAALFVLAAVLALAFAAGVRPVAAGVASWVLLVSLQARNPLVGYGGDTLLHILLFWGTLTLAAARAREEVEVPGAPRGRVLSGPGAAHLLQVVMLYVFAGLLKTGEAWQIGTAVDLVMQTELGTPLGRKLAELLPGGYSTLTLGVVPFEIFGPLLLLVPQRFGLVRMAGVLAFFGLHISFALFLNIGLFPLFSCVALLPFLPSWFWDVPAARLLSLAERAQALGRGWLRGLAAAHARRGVMLLDGAAIVALLLTLGWNLRTWDQDLKLPRWARATVIVLALNQEWKLFAPGPTRALSGVEVWGAGSDDAAPERLEDNLGYRDQGDAEPYATHRWRKLMEALRHGDRPRLYSAYLAYVCRNARDASGKKLDHVQLMFTRRVMGASGFGPPEARRQVYEHTCR